MKYITISFFACLFILGACTKEAKYNPAEEHSYVLKKNAYRVTKITGTSTYWGDFTLIMNYDREQLENAFRINSQGDTVGQISITRYSSTSIKYSILDYIPNIDPDSIHRMDERFKILYGSGHYSLWDSVPKVARAIMEQDIYLYPDGRMERQISRTYKPRKDVGITGINFNNNYILLTTVYNTYEYDWDSNIHINRIMSDIHDPDDKDLYERSLYKDEIIYSKGLLKGVISYAANNGSSFKENNRYNFSYNGHQLTAINGTNFTRQFAYKDSKLTLTTNGAETQYEFDENGYVTKINDGQGNIFNITYEAGNGNFSIFTPVHEQMLNTPFVK